MLLENPLPPEQPSPVVDLDNDVNSVPSEQPSLVDLDGRLDEVAARGDHECECDLVAALTRLTAVNERLVESHNVLGQQVQYMTDGLKDIIGFFGSLGPDLQAMSLPDKIRAIKNMIG